MRTGRGVIVILCIVLGMTASMAAYGQALTVKLFTAVEVGNVEAVRQVLQAGVDLEARNGEGLTPLMAAVEAGNLEVVRELLNAGADVNARIGFYGITALTLASQYGEDSEIARVLRDAGAREDIQDERRGIPMIVTEME